jgi:hypothetical protein
VFIHKNILNLAIKYIKRHKKIANFSSNFFLCSWYDNLGFLCLKEFAGQKIPYWFRIKTILKELIFSNYISLKNNSKINSNNYENIILSYFFPKNLEKNGNYFDKYFSIKANKLKKTLLILIPVDDFKYNGKINNNIIILQKNKKINFFILLKILLDVILNFCNSIFFLKLHRISVNNTFDKNLLQILISLIKTSKIKKILYPFESQPHQNFINLKLKKIFPKIRIIGYMHTVLPPLPLEYIKKGCEPDILFVNGDNQKKILVNKLGWPSNKVKSIPSLRFKKKLSGDMTKKIFLPYFLESEDKFLILLKKLIFSKPKYFFPKLEVKNHPSMHNSKRHLNLLKKINYFLVQEKKFFRSSSKNKNISIFLGSTASVIEGLERNLKVYHICSNEIFEKFDKFYWKDLKVTRVQKNIFKYKILKKGKFIRLSKGNNLRKIFN